MCRHCWWHSRALQQPATGHQLQAHVSCQGTYNIQWSSIMAASALQAAGLRRPTSWVLVRPVTVDLLPHQVSHKVLKVLVQLL